MPLRVANSSGQRKQCWRFPLNVIMKHFDNEFWNGLEVVQLRQKIPRLEDAVLCVGFPVVGDTISFTSGVVSSIEVMIYTQASAELLGIQIDAAINRGNSGLAFNENGECVGVAFKSIGAEEAEYIGYMIPCVAVMRFLTDLLENARYHKPMNIEKKLNDACLRLHCPVHVQMV